MPEQPLQTSSLGSQIAARLRQDILLGRLRSGQALRQDALCEQYGTSRMPVRDALRILVNEGLLIMTGTRRTVVAPITIADIEDSYAIEALVHGRAGRRAARNATATDVDALAILHEQMIVAADAGDFNRVAELNWRFHRSINVLAHSPKLMAMLRAASTNIPRDYLVDMPEWMERSHREHVRVIAALRNGADTEVEWLLRSHVEEAGRSLVARLVKDGHLEAEHQSSDEASDEVSGSADAAASPS